MISATAITCIILNMVGGCSLLLLLCTYFVVKDLPQRKNPVLINMILVSYLATIAPLMLLFTGQQGGITIQWICILQSALIDGIVPMYLVAFVALVIQTWSQLRAIVQNTTSTIPQSALVQWMLLLAPYIVYLCWFIASLTLALQPSAKVILYPFFYCSNDPSTGNDVRGQLGYFVVLSLVITLFLEVWIACVVFACLRRGCVCGDLAHASSLYRTSLYMYIRLCISTVMQLCPIILTVLNYWGVTTNRIVADKRNATQIVASMYPLIVFLIFGTQRTVLQAWKVMPGPKAEPEVPNV